MKPENQINNITPEQVPAQFGARVEQNYSISTPELMNKSTAEKASRTSENTAADKGVILTTVLPTPVIDNTNVVNNATISSSSSFPSAAADDDLIEKEWVDKAKKIVNDTKNDPHQREKAVNLLQVDYLKKRYGREIGIVK